MAGNGSGFPLRLEKMDFEQFGGKFKSKTARKVKKGDYYRNFMIVNKPPLLRYYMQHNHSHKKLQPQQ